LGAGIKVTCEPQLGKRNLYPTLSSKSSGDEISLMMDFITWSDGTNSMLDIAEICDVPIWKLYPIAKTLSQHNLITLFDNRVIL
jgi:aminopeptidase-like protein